MGHAPVLVRKYSNESIGRHFQSTVLSSSGLRMGKMVTKIGLIMLLQKYDFECLRKGGLEFDNHSVTLVLRGGIDMKVSHRK